MHIVSRIMACVWLTGECKDQSKQRSQCSFVMLAHLASGNTSDQCL